VRVTSPHDPLLHVLTRHGISDAAARAIQAVSQDVRARTLAHRVEFAAMLDAETGEMIGAIIQGERLRTEIRSHIDAMRSERGYVQVHTHPGSRSFSPEDMVLLAAFRTVCAMVVAGADGTMYVASFVAEARSLDTELILSAWDAEWDILLLFYGPLIVSGALTLDEAARAQSHEVWLRLAPRFGLRYDRVEP